MRFTGPVTTFTIRNKMYFNEHFIVLPPLIIKQPTSTTVELFGQVMFECTVQTVGKTSIVWEKDLSPLPVTAAINNITSLNEATSILTITGVNGFYGGLYYCIAKNKAGQTMSRYASLSVQGKCCALVKYAVFTKVLKSLAMKSMIS